VAEGAEYKAYAEGDALEQIQIVVAWYRSC
jgi:hypothetical protein